MLEMIAVDSSDCDPEYIEWYYKFSHPCVENPVRCSGLFKRSSVVARPTYNGLISRMHIKSKEHFEDCDRWGSAHCSAWAIAEITEAYQILSVGDYSASSASKDLVDGSSASSASKDPVDGSFAPLHPNIRLMIWLVVRPENEGCVVVDSDDGGPINVKKRKTTNLEGFPQKALAATEGFSRKPLAATHQNFWIPTEVSCRNKGVPTEVSCRHRGFLTEVSCRHPSKLLDSHDIKFSPQRGSREGSCRHRVVPTEQSFCS
ncbi:hypothetical protein IFM89_004849 [Coptis chinensis]|uniref:Uncharacterized protein n=1 Tax=Coptis chinensis TaxID=261450 RepID=A0A835H1J7_9MAGN|nr:hypothetical protein IFM89_004849 [Coptis chinensis]